MKLVGPTKCYDIPIRGISHMRPMTSRSPMNKNIVGPQEMTNLMNSHNLQCQLFALSSVPASGSRHQLF